MRKNLYRFRIALCLSGMTLAVLLFLINCQKTLAIYDPLSVPNNKFGIHVLDTGEIDKAAQFANSSGGEWGYVTIPIRANDRDLDKWTQFMTRARELKIIPILRIATFPVPGTAEDATRWAAPNELDLVDFANFLDQLPWPTKNRYVIVYNEPNHESEWGGFVDPAEYARVLDRAIDIFHKENPDYFVISAGLDASQPNNYDYLFQMKREIPDIFDKVDGLSFHAYGNPAFDTAPNIYSRVNVASFRFDEKYLNVNKPIFLTETGWKKPADWFFPNAFDYAWNDANIVAVTPFLLDGGNGPFADFSFLKFNGDFDVFAKTIMNMPKIKGQPQLAETQNSKPKIQNNIFIDSGFRRNDNPVDLIKLILDLLKRIFG